MPKPKKKLPKLVPPDRERCQSLCGEGSFMTLGPREVVRCSNKPKWVVKERKPGEDGRRGSMSLCNACLSVMIAQKGPDYAFVTFIK